MQRPERGGRLGACSPTLIRLLQGGSHTMDYSQPPQQPPQQYTQQPQVCNPCQWP